MIAIIGVCISKSEVIYYMTADSKHTIRRPWHIYVAKSSSCYFPAEA